MVVEVMETVARDRCLWCNAPVVQLRSSTGRLYWMHDGDTLEKNCKGSPEAEPTGSEDRCYHGETTQHTITSPEPDGLVYVCPGPPTKGSSSSP